MGNCDTGWRISKQLSEHSGICILVHNICDFRFTRLFRTLYIVQHPFPTVSLFSLILHLPQENISWQTFEHTGDALWSWAEMYRPCHRQAAKQDGPLHGVLRKLLLRLLMSMIFMWCFVKFLPHSSSSLLGRISILSKAVFCIVISKHFLRGRVKCKTLEVISDLNYSNEMQWESPTLSYQLFMMAATKVYYQDISISLIWDNRFLFLWFKLLSPEDCIMRPCCIPGANTVREAPSPVERLIVQEKRECCGMQTTPGGSRRDGEDW